MLSDPLAGTFVDTAFDARYCSFQIHRLLVVDGSAVLAAAAAVPSWDRIMVRVNDGTYGNPSSWIGNGAVGVDGPFIGINLGAAMAPLLCT